LDHLVTAPRGAAVVPAQRRGYHARQRALARPAVAPGGDRHEDRDRMTHRTALLVIDAQAGLLDPAYRRDETIAAINGLIAKARAAGAPVIYVQHDGGAEDRAWVGTPAWRIHPAVLQPAGDPVVRKEASDSFYRTSLLDDLTRLGVRTVVVSGLNTEMCIDTTCRIATSLGFDVILAADAHTTRDRHALPPAQVVAHHNAVLDDFGNDAAVVRVVPSAGIAF
jgi:nicotinamidase-related amidase